MQYVMSQPAGAELVRLGGCCDIEDCEFIIVGCVEPVPRDSFLALLLLQRILSRLDVPDS